MPFTSPHKFSFNALHKYPNATYHYYLLHPEKIHYSGLDPIERTFVKENKSFWRNVVISNIKELRRLKEDLKSLYQAINLQGCNKSEDQARYEQKLLSEIESHTKAIKVAITYRVKGVGYKKTQIDDAKKVLTFYQRLRVLCRTTENLVFKGSMVEDALGIFQKHVFREDPTEAKCGIDNEALLKRIIAYFNCSDDDRDLFMARINTCKVSERLSLLARNSGCRVPIYQMRQ